MDERTKNLIWDIVFRWIILDFLFCFVPLAFTYLYDCIVGYRFEFEDVLSDFCLCVFAVTINAFSNEVDVRKYKGEYIRLIMIFISLIGAIICLFMSSIVIAHSFL